MNFAKQLQYNRDKIEYHNELFGSKPCFPTLNNSTLKLLDVIVPLVADQIGSSPCRRHRPVKKIVRRTGFYNPPICLKLTNVENIPVSAYEGIQSKRKNRMSGIFQTGSEPLSYLAWHIS